MLEYTVFAATNWTDQRMSTYSKILLILNSYQFICPKLLNMFIPNKFKFIFSFLVLFLLVSCKKNEPPTCGIIEPADGLVVSKGDVISVSVETDDPDGIVTEVRLFVNGIGVTGLAFPYTYDLNTNDYKPGQYTIKVTAWDNEGLEASDEVEVTISVAQSQVTTTAANSITYNSAVVGGSVIDEGGGTLTESGIYWDTVSSSEMTGIKIPMAQDVKEFSDTIHELPCGSRIYFRAYAINDAGTALGQELNFLTNTIPTVQTGSHVDSITHESAIVHGEVTDDGGEAIIEGGFYLSSEPDPELTGTRMIKDYYGNDFHYKLTGLTPATSYYVKAFAVNAAGESLGEEISFTTNGAPTVITSSVISLKFKLAEVGGDVTDDGGELITEKGIYWGGSSNPEMSGTKLQAGDGLGTFTASLTGLNPGTIYYYKAYAMNDAGESLGDELSFEATRIDTGSFIDTRDNEQYGLAYIGEQVWMTENLRATVFNDGNEIPHLPDSLSWFHNTGPAYCWYENDYNNNGEWGALYTWYAVNTDKLCPSGWHMPSDQDWKQLEIFLGMDEAVADLTNFRGDQEGGMMKTTEYWIGSNTGATNETMMAIIPVGSRTFDSWFGGKGWETFFWTSDELTATKSYIREFTYNRASISRTSENKNSGYNVRCVKDE